MLLVKTRGFTSAVAVKTGGGGRTMTSIPRTRTSVRHDLSFLYYHTVLLIKRAVLLLKSGSFTSKTGGFTSAVGVKWAVAVERAVLPERWR